MIGRGSKKRQAQSGVYGLIEGRQLHRNQALIVIKSQDSIRAVLMNSAAPRFRSTQPAAVWREWASQLHAGMVVRPLLQQWIQPLLLLTSKLPLFSGMGVEASYKQLRGGIESQAEPCQLAELAFNELCAENLVTGRVERRSGAEFSWHDRLWAGGVSVYA